MPHSAAEHRTRGFDGSSADSRVDRPPLAASMAITIVLLSALAFWDARRESRAALGDFAAEQAIVARGIASAVASRARSSVATTGPDAVDFLAEVRSVEKASSLRLLVAKPGLPGLSTTDARIVRDGNVERALSVGTPWVRLGRDEATAFSLPKRTAIAGLSTFDGPGGKWGVVVAATALRERDREARAQWRSVVCVILGSALVLAFGGLAMRRQKKELSLARELTVAALERDREEQIVRIDKLATMAALATGIAHEVSTPLGVIVGRAEQLLPKVLTDERAKRGVESIIEQGTFISRVVRGFLDLARGETPRLEHVDPAAVVRASRELVEHRFERAGVTLVVRVEPNLPRVACDPRLLEQVIIHLLLNGCDACESGGHVELSVRADRERLAFVVVDDGVGITPEVAARAVEPFFTPTAVAPGAGLGLAIAHEIVKHHGGELSIGARPREGRSGETHVRGTRACVELPVVKE